jgi:hypothetical protein
MKRKRRKIFRSPEERAAWESAREARIQELHRLIARAEQELAERRAAGEAGAS